MSAAKAGPPSGSMSAAKNAGSPSGSTSARPGPAADPQVSKRPTVRKEAEESDINFDDAASFDLGAGMEDAEAALEAMQNFRLAEAALQLWSAAQTDFDPFEVPSEQWPEQADPVRDADIAVDTRLDLDDVRAALRRLEGVKLVVGRDGRTLSVVRMLPEDTPL